MRVSAALHIHSSPTLDKNIQKQPNKWWYFAAVESLSHIWLFRDPVYCSPPGSSVHGISQQEYWSGLSCPPPEDLPNPRMKPISPVPPALAGRFFTTKPPGKPKLWHSLVAVNGALMEMNHCYVQNHGRSSQIYWAKEDKHKRVDDKWLPLHKVKNQQRYLTMNGDKG